MEALRIAVGSVLGIAAFILAMPFVVHAMRLVDDYWMFMDDWLRGAT